MFLKTLHQGRCYYLIQLKLHQNVMVPIYSSPDLPRYHLSFLLRHIHEDHLSSAAVGKPDSIFHLEVCEVDGLLLFLLVVLGRFEVASAVHVPHYGHVAERVAHHGRGEVLGGAQDVCLAHWDRKMVFDDSQGVTAKPADLGDAVFWLSMFKTVQETVNVSDATYYYPDSCLVT